MNFDSVSSGWNCRTGHEIREHLGAFEGVSFYDFKFSDVVSSEKRIPEKPRRGTPKEIVKMLGKADSYL